MARNDADLRSCIAAAGAGRRLLGQRATIGRRRQIRSRWFRSAPVEHGRGRPDRSRFTARPRAARRPARWRSSAPAEAMVDAHRLPRSAAQSRAGQAGRAAAPEPDDAALDLARAAADAARRRCGACARRSGCAPTGWPAMPMSRPRAPPPTAPMRCAPASAQRDRALTLRAPARGLCRERSPPARAICVAAGRGRRDDRAAGRPARAASASIRRLARALRPGTPLRDRAPAGGAPIDASAVQSVDPVVDPQTRLAVGLRARCPATPASPPGEPLTGTIVHAARAATRSPFPMPRCSTMAASPLSIVVAGGVAHRHDVETGADERRPHRHHQGRCAPASRSSPQGGTALEDGMKVRTK